MSIIAVEKLRNIRVRLNLIAGGINYREVDPSPNGYEYGAQSEPFKWEDIKDITLNDEELIITTEHHGELYRREYSTKNEAAKQWVELVKTKLID
jgi:hypothetical protein